MPVDDSFMVVEVGLKVGGLWWLGHSIYAVVLRCDSDHGPWWLSMFTGWDTQVCVWSQWLACGVECWV
jgi:hypothetical protein